MIDWRFIYNRYVNHVRLDRGFKWDYPDNAMLLWHDEQFLEDIIFRSGGVFADVGANVGAWAIRASPYYRLVVAYEPNPVCFRALRRNIRLNHRSNIFPCNFALDNTSGLKNEPILAPRAPGQPMREFETSVQTLDEQKLEELTVLKIDAEGGARRIIAAGFQTILRCHPTVIVEVHTSIEASVPDLLPAYSWQKRYRPMPHIGDWLYREEGKQVFLIGTS